MVMPLSLPPQSKLSLKLIIQTFLSFFYCCQRCYSKKSAKKKNKTKFNKLQNQVGKKLQRSLTNATSFYWMPTLSWVQIHYHLICSIWYQIAKLRKLSIFMASLTYLICSDISQKIQLYAHVSSKLLSGIYLLLRSRHAMWHQDQSKKEAK